MNRKQRRSAARQGGGDGTAPTWTPPQRDGVAGALMQHASGAAPATPGGAADTGAELRIAVGHLESGHAAAAERHLRAILEMRPEDPVALQLMGVVAQEQGRSDEALERLQAAVALAPDYAEAQHNLGLVLLNRGEGEAAGVAFAAALELKPEFLSARLNLGNALRAQADYAGAQAAYRAVLAADPQSVEAQLNLGNVLRDQGELDEAVAAYDQALAGRPDYAEAHHNRGSCLFEMGRVDDAIAAHEKAVALVPDDRDFVFALQEARSRQIPGWHLTMLADGTRNEAYAAALSRHVRPGMTVLDIGTGSGLLAMLAARAGAAHVYAVEGVPSLAAAAREIVAANGLAERITVLEARSTQLAVGAQLPRPVDLVVAEVFDTGLLGEGALPTLWHAGRQLLAPDGVIMPARADVYAMLVDLPRWRAVNPVREICGFDLSAFDRFRNPYVYHQMALNAEAHVALSAPFHVVGFDFRDPPLVQRQRTEMVPVTAAGEAHAVAFWFELHLDDQAMVSTAPGSALDHWRQSVQFFDRGRTVRPGDTLPLVVGHSDTRLFFEL